MPTSTQQLDLSSAIANLRSAEQSIDNLVALTGDPNTLAQLTTAQQMLNQAIQQLRQAQAIADDTLFSQAANALKAQAASLKSKEATIQSIISNTAIAAQVVGYVAQAVIYIMAL
jgi:multidrug resistance efflux pump